MLAEITFGGFRLSELIGNQVRVLDSPAAVCSANQ